MKNYTRSALFCFLLMATCYKVSLAGGDGPFPAHMNGALIDLTNIEFKVLPIELVVPKIGQPNDKLPCHLPKKLEAGGEVRVAEFVYEVRGVCLEPKKGLVEIVAIHPFGPNVVKHVWLQGSFTDEGKQFHGGLVVGIPDKAPSYEFHLQSR